MVPLVGVVGFGWDLFGVMWLYWAENGVIGAFALLRILTAGEGHWLNTLLRVPMGAFFVVHFGLFWFVHGVFVYALFGGGVHPFLLDGATWREALQGVPVEGLVALVLSHGASFVLNFLVGGERLTTTSEAEMGKPYGRVVLLHVVIFAAGFLMLATNGPVWALAVFVVLKTAIDLGVHLTGDRIRLGAPDAEGDDVSTEATGGALPEAAPTTLPLGARPDRSDPEAVPLVPGRRGR